MVKQETKEKIEDKKKKEELKEKVLERAKEMQKEVETKDLKKELEENIKEGKTLVPVEEYLKYGVYLGTKVITPYLKPFVYKRRADGIAVIDVNQIDKKIKKAIDFLSKYEPEDFIVVCKREIGWQAAKLFSELIGCKCFTKKYPAGILTNPNIKDFIEPDMVFVCDPWVDKNAAKDAKLMNKKLLALCDTNNYAKDADLFIPCNNKINKSFALIFYILAKGYLEKKGIKKQIPPITDFIGEEK